MTERLLSHTLSPLPSVAELRRRNRRRRQRRWVGASVSSGVVIALLAFLVVLPGFGVTSNTASGTRLAAYITSATQVSDQVLEEVGLPVDLNPPLPLSGQPALTDRGKPAVVYVGAEFCPFCAVARWALVVALSKFGTFSNLGQAISSSSSDVYPGIRSWSFYGSSYSSPHLVFDSAEVASGASSPLGSLSPLQQRVFSKYDQAPYTPSRATGAIPFIDVANRYLQIGADADPSVLEGLSLDQIAADLHYPSSPVAQALDGSANYLIAALCSVVGRRAAPICASSTIVRAEAVLDGTGPIPTTVPAATSSTDRT